ncbi:unnamed protein product, partial [Ectocarpus sp. 12 AP-2014]
SPVSTGAGVFGEAAQAGGSGSTAGSDDADTDWDLELGLVGPGTGRTGEPSPNNVRDVKRANIAEGLRALLRGAPQGDKHQSGASDARQGLTGVPDKCRVVGKLLKGGRAGPDVTIVKYPRACHLLCLRVSVEQDNTTAGTTAPPTDAGGSFGGALTLSKGKGRAMHGQRMVEWLETLISKRADLYRSKNELRAANSRLV